VPESSVIAALVAAQQAPQVRLLLDYDGTLVPLVRVPQRAAPDEELLALLADVAEVPSLRVDIVSGRSRETLAAWLGELPLALWAEHGFWHRSSPGNEWRAAAPIDNQWMPRVRDVLVEFTARTPGSMIEAKSASIAWHYRGAQREFGARQADALRMLLGDALSNQPLEVLEGKKVVEVRPRGVSKALVAQNVECSSLPGATVVAIGDDRTDDDLFRALPVSSVTIGVGRGSTCARFNVEDYRAVRSLLRLFATTSA
jgi:trehalose 6-phosphate synthase/phosphatase